MDSLTMAMQPPMPGMMPGAMPGTGMPPMPPGPPPEPPPEPYGGDGDEPSMPSLGKMRRPSQKKADEIVSNFRQHLRAAVSMKSQVEETAIKAYCQFCSIIQTTGKVAYLLKVHDPHFFATVTSNVAAELAQLLGQPKILQFRPRGLTSDVIANYFTAAFDYHWKENPRSRLEVVDLIFQKRVFGNAFGVTFWHEDFRKVGHWQTTQVPKQVLNVDPMTGAMSIGQTVESVKEFVTERKQTKNSAWYKTLNFFRCYPDAEAPSVAEGRFFIYYERRPLSYVKEMMKQGQWFSAACKEILDNPSAFTGFEGEDTAKMLSNGGVGGNDPGLDGVDPLIDVHEYMTPDGKAVVVGQRLVVSYREGYVTGYYPIVHVKNHHAPGEFWGMSDLVPVETQLVALQNMYSAQVTETILQVFRPIIVTDPAINVDRFKYTPGAIWQAPGGQANSIQPLQTDPTGIQHGANLCNDLRGRIDVALSSSDTRRGSIPTRSTSATAVNASEANANIRQAPSSIENEDGFVNQLGEQFARLIMTCQTDDITTRLNHGAEIVTIKAELLNQDLELEVECVAGAQQASELEQKRLLELGNLAMNFHAPTFNVEEFIKVVAEAAVPRIADRIIMNPMQAQQQAMLQQQMAMLSGQAGPGPGNGQQSRPTGMGATELGGMQELQSEAGGQQRVD